MDTNHKIIVKTGFWCDESHIDFSIRMPYKGFEIQIDGSNAVVNVFGQDGGFLTAIQDDSGEDSVVNKIVLAKKYILNRTVGGVAQQL